MEKAYTEKELEEACRDAYKDGFIDGRRLGWLEAAIDSEGYLGIVKSRETNYTPRLCISTKDENFMEYFRSTSNVTKKLRKNLTMHTLEIASKYQLKPLLEKVELIIKERQRLLLLEAYNLLPGSGHKTEAYNIKRLDEIFMECKRLNSGGE